MVRIRIVTDSTSDVPPDVAERLNITVVPAYVQIGEMSYRDGEGLSRAEFYAQLPTMPQLPTTASPSAGEFAQAYRGLAQEADEIVSIHAAATLSGIYNAARLGAEDVPEVRVHLVDSGQTTLGLGWQVVAAAEAAGESRGGEEIVSLVEAMKPRVRVYAMLDTTEYLRRSGRVTWARTAAAHLLRIKPLIELREGAVTLLARVRTRLRAIQRLVELAQALGPLERLAFLHTHSPDLDEFRRQLAGLCPPENTLTVEVTTIIGTHVGPRGLGLAAVMAG